MEFLGTYKGRDYYKMDGHKFIIYIPKIGNIFNEMYKTEFETMEEVKEKS